mgnify:CR=1 FL=1
MKSDWLRNNCVDFVQVDVCFKIKKSYNFYLTNETD